MSYRLLIIVLSSALGIATGVTAADQAGTNKRPNIVLIMVDDMGFSDIGCYGGEIATPNIDRLASEGMRFTQFYNNAKCTTTRASLLTGLYARQARGQLLGTDMVTLGEVLQSAGYHTVLSGKWHLGHGATTHPYHRGFAEVYGLLDGCSNHFDPAQRDPAYKGGAVRYFAHNDERITSFPPDFYSTDAFTDHAIGELRDAVKRQQPVFLHLTYTAPHYPLHARPEVIAKYVGKYTTGWDALRAARYQRQCQMGLIPDPSTWALSGHDRRVKDWSAVDATGEDHRMAVYAAMIDHVDQAIGRLITALKETGQYDNTVLMFLSDNGGCTEDPGPGAKGNAGPKDDYVCVGAGWGWAANAPFCRYKSWIHEGGISTPLIVRWPGQVQAGSYHRGVGHIIDLMPTLVEIGAATYPTTFAKQQILPMEGHSLVPAFRGQPPTVAPLGWMWEGSRGLRDGRYKAVMAGDVKRWELYDLEADRSETHDLATEKPQVLARLVADWKAWAERTDSLPRGKTTDQEP
ncbi:MAG: arylsulfatase [Planctomycetes bacterium]|nr:arylsulfatase [Planctomycetota bacterium]